MITLKIPPKYVAMLAKMCHDQAELATHAQEIKICEHMARRLDESWIAYHNSPTSEEYIIERLPHDSNI